MTEGGFLLNNELTDFSFAPEEDGKPVANRVEPGKRPRSSMAPTIVFDAYRPALRRHRLARRQPDHQLSWPRRWSRILDWKLDPQDAVDLPNFGRRNGPTELEAGHRGRRLEGGARGAWATRSA